MQLVVDFGTELEGALELAVTARESATVIVAFGESVPEAESWGLETRCREQLPPKEMWQIDGKGAHRVAYSSRGLRFVRLHFFDLTGPLTLTFMRVRARFTFDKRRGDFACSDRLLQRVWQSSVYTARLCTMPDTIWDGIKRDRVGWYGDARITKETIDTVYFDPRPSVPMMTRLPTDAWANEIPVYSFDCIAMLRQHLAMFGTDDARAVDVFEHIEAMLAWAERTQVNRRGFLVRNDNVKYQFGIGFIDWSPQPRGGRFEELSWLQCSYVEALRNAAVVAQWLGHAQAARRYDAQARRLAAKVRSRFWRKGAGFDHTLNKTHRGPWRMPLQEGEHYRETYLDRIRLGPSGPSRQSTARAVWAGILDDSQMRFSLAKVFRNPRIPAIITPYYRYYENMARAACGDVDGALLDMRDYVGQMLQTYDSATVWESFEPEVQGIRAYSLGTWPKSMCHGWSSGMVGLVYRHVLGIDIAAPGYARVTLNPRSDLNMTFEATVPTPHGPLRCVKPQRNGPVEYTVPQGIECSVADTDRAHVSGH
ncbi:MAG: Bacterial alpha-L-rhamnosidase [Chitinivibrionales bacterium]|nr:Bacterial alpha-L-rhamnosidase [Chitinivibrionales bacterium]